MSKKAQKIFGIFFFVFGLLFLGMSPLLAGFIAWIGLTLFLCAVMIKPKAPTKEREVLQNEKPKGEYETFKVAGVSYYPKSFDALRETNEDYKLTKRDLPYDVRVYEYEYSYKDISFEDEPTNPYDPNAIKVLIDGHHVGYIKKGSTSRFRKLRDMPDFKVEADIGGGKYKYYDSETEKVDRDEIPCFVHLRVYHG